MSSTALGIVVFCTNRPWRITTLNCHQRPLGCHQQLSGCVSPNPNFSSRLSSSPQFLYFPSLGNKSYRTNYMENNNGTIPYSILDFLLFKPISDDLLRKLLSTPPPSSPPSSLIFRKSLLIRSISSDPFSENTLSCIETILHHNRNAYGPLDLALAQNAYFHAAVGFTLNELKKGDYFGYVSAVNRFWETRMDSLDVDLVSEKLLKWKDFMICGVEVYIMRETMLMKWNEKEGRDAILMFRLAVIDGMEPHSLELTAIKMVTMNESNVNDREGADDLGLNSVDENNGVHFAVDKSDALEIENMELGGDASGALAKKSISTAEVQKVTGNLKRSCEDLMKVVQDPLPVIMLASTSAPVGVCNDNSPVADGDQCEARVRCPTAYANDVIHKLNNLAYICVVFCLGLSHVVSIDFSDFSSESEVDSDNSSDHASKKIRLPLPRGFKVSPLESLKSPQLPRKGKRWSDEEVNALREGVIKYGKGNWRTIKISYPGVFQDKSLKALRLKWRNMTSPP